MTLRYRQVKNARNGEKLMDTENHSKFAQKMKEEFVLEGQPANNVNYLSIFDFAT